jgi:hypothetical protein
MNSEHNPIANLITQIQQKWNDEVVPHQEYKAVRWLIKANQARLYEGFLRLESTENGSIPEVVIVLLTSFKSISIHSSDLINDLVKSFEADEKTAAALQQTGTGFNWDVRLYKNLASASGTDHDLLLLQMLASFQKAMPDNKSRLVLALYPYNVSDAGDYVSWVEQIMKKGIPDKVLLMLFDYVEDRHFDKLFQKNLEITKSLAADLDLEGAMAKLATAGDPGDPEVQFRTCMMEMAEGVKSENIAKIHTWGNRGLEISQQTGNKSFFGTAHLVYAGMLFNFYKKETENIDRLLTLGLAVVRKGLAAGDKNCQPLELQFYGYKGAASQLEGKEKDAAEIFMKQGELALTYEMPVQALMAWWQSCNLWQRVDSKKFAALAEKAWLLGKGLAAEELQASCFSYIAYDYYKHCENLRQHEICREIDDLIKELHGDDWMVQVEKFKEDTKKKKRFLFV